MFYLFSSDFKQNGHGVVRVFTGDLLPPFACLFSYSVRQHGDSNGRPWQRRHQRSVVLYSLCSCVRGASVWSHFSRQPRSLRALMSHAAVLCFLLNFIIVSGDAVEVLLLSPLGLKIKMQWAEWEWSTFSFLFSPFLFVTPTSRIGFMTISITISYSLRS